LTSPFSGSSVGPARTRKLFSYSTRSPDAAAFAEVQAVQLSGSRLALEQGSERDGENRRLAVVEHGLSHTSVEASGPHGYALDCQAPLGRFGGATSLRGPEE